MQIVEFFVKWRKVKKERGNRFDPFKAVFTLNLLKRKRQPIKKLRRSGNIWTIRVYLHQKYEKKNVLSTNSVSFMRPFKFKGECEHDQ